MAPGETADVLLRCDVLGTAFGHRTRQYDLLLLGQWDDPEADETNIAWGSRAYDALAPHLADAIYVNDLGSDGPDRVEPPTAPITTDSRP